MDSILIFLILVLFVVVVFLLVVIYQKLNKPVQQDKSMELMMRWMEQVQVRLDRSQENVGAKLDKTSEVLHIVGQRIGEMSEIGRSMRDIGDLLKSPKLRGNLGEYILKDLLRQYLPASSFLMQYAFKNGAIVDAVIKTDNGLLCIDAKFPLENFRKYYADGVVETEKERIQKEFVRDVRKHIEAISTKYINPTELSFDYALMYIPSEAVYYEIICNHHELVEYAQQKCVIIVSPSVFYAYLQVILLSLEGRKVEEKAHELLRSFKGLQGEFRKFASQFMLGHKHLTNAKNVFDGAQIQYQSVQTRLDSLARMSGEPVEISPLPDMPYLEDNQ
jgi:DNA recombination protein RmuC